MLRRSFLDGLDERICYIETAWVSIAKGHVEADDGLELIESEVHRISGIAGSFGLSSLGKQAQALELLIIEARKNAMKAEEMSKLAARVNAFLDLMEQELDTL